MSAKNIVLLILLVLVMALWALILLGAIPGDVKAISWLPFFAVLILAAFAVFYSGPKA